MKQPGLPIPEPLRASEQPSFTHYSVVTRLPEIARRTLRENAFSPETELMIQDLISEIGTGTIRPLHLPANRAGDWDRWTQPYLGQSWLDVPWFFAEEYFYARILEASGYFQPGQGFEKDPYARQKKMGLESTKKEINLLAEQVAAALALPREAHVDSLARLLLMDLWGNQNDLSMWPVLHDGEGLAGGKAAENAQQIDPRARLLADNTETVLAFVAAQDPKVFRVDILLDNAGYELAADLALADFLLQSRLACKVCLHAKAYPVFVSDALDTDVHKTLDFLIFSANATAHAMGVRLRSALVENRLCLRSDPFWTSPLAGWEMPPDLETEIGQSHLLISKGDANYRRLLGDRHWKMETPFAQVVDYFAPAVLAIRTLKSEIGVGIAPEAVPTTDPDWMINGRWGLIQFAPPHAA